MQVVAIIDKNHSRAASGTLRPMQNSSHTFATFAPTDSRIPRIMIPTSDLPQGESAWQSLRPECWWKRIQTCQRLQFRHVIFAETDNLRIYGQVKINKVKICLVRMGLICLCFGEETRLCVISQSEALSVTHFASL